MHPWGRVHGTQHSNCERGKCVHGVTSVVYFLCKLPQVSWWNPKGCNISVLHELNAKHWPSNRLVYRHENYPKGGEPCQLNRTSSSINAHGTGPLKTWASSQNTGTTKDNGSADPHRNSILICGDPYKTNSLLVLYAVRVKKPHPAGQRPHQFITQFNSITSRYHSK